MSSRNTGTCKWMNSAKGYGFLVPDNGGSDVFVHISGIESNNPLQEGQKVTYDLSPDRQGRMTAVNVRPVAA